VFTPSERFQELTFSGNTTSINRAFHSDVIIHLTKRKKEKKNPLNLPEIRKTPFV
jgi:hypothetical protein